MTFTLWEQSNHTKYHQKIPGMPQLDERASAEETPILFIRIFAATGTKWS